MRSFLIVLVSPGPAGMEDLLDTSGPVLNQELVSKSAVETLYKGVFNGLARLVEIQHDVVLLRSKLWDAPQLNWYFWAGLCLFFIINIQGMTELNWGRSVAYYNAVFGVAPVLGAVNLDAKQ